MDKHYRKSGVGSRLILKLLTL
ncbi:hypothetical protein U8M14_09055 [Virgibacillus pantothenticus]|nr:MULTISPECIES: hypothetical protein [Virgibacillus]MEB5451962.1 hypothetical protein [Virgibacillus pantothenticus]MEB5456104.1 hypothetical protein [Virgibacillus pantothenticus]MEB5460155.1 hypothetical protein [Virgibacillus pantothenticus]MEB5464565.1 hypothetical protein [Virgibacillus pantothenticus]MEB5468856.1 hypothetical protein [Virgibacillus pantothenticus]